LSADRERGLDWKNDERRLRHYVLPSIGEVPIAEVRPRHLADMFHKLRTDQERDLAVVSAMLRDARLADVIKQTPCILDERQLGALTDKDPEWRASEAIPSHPQIPPERTCAEVVKLRIARTRPAVSRYIDRSAE
jgi:hypothetical protein